MVRIGNVVGDGSFGQLVGDAAVTAGGGVAGVSRMHFGSGGSCVGPTTGALLTAVCGDEDAALESIQTSVVLTGSAGAWLQLAVNIEKTTALESQARNTPRLLTQNKPSYAQASTASSTKRKRHRTGGPGGESLPTRCRQQPLRRSCQHASLKNPQKMTQSSLTVVQI
jgi:hypothetical protein